MNKREITKYSRKINSKIAFWIIDWLVPVYDHTSVFGDFEELFEAKTLEKGKRFACLWLWFQLFKSIPKFIKKSIFWSIEMFRNYIKVAFRNILKNKVYSTINISGLAIGIAASFLIMLFVFDEISYDRYHEKADRIYRICARGMIGDTKIDQAWTCAPLPEALMREFPEVENAVRLTEMRNVSIGYGDRIYDEPMIIRADSTLFNVFSFKLIQGDPATALKKPRTVVISESAAEKYFPDEDPIGKVIAVNGLVRFTVTGIMENIPRNSHFHFDVAVSLSTYGYSRNTNWMSNNFKDYIVLREGYPWKDLEKKFPDFILRNIGQGNENWLGAGNYWEYYLQPLTDIHLHSNINGELEPNGNIAYVYIFLVVSIFIIIIASINFMNLTTAKSATRAKEVGIRKVVGSNKSMLIRQFLSESILSSLIALIIAIILINITLPSYRNLIGSPIETGFLENYLILPILTGVTLAVGIVSGLYPSVFLSAYKPVNAIKGIFGKGRRRGFNLRNGLVVFQFTISIFLIVGTIIVFRQLQYFQNKNLGFQKESILVLKEPMRLRGEIVTFKEKILQSPNIKSFSFSTTLPGSEHNNWYIEPEAMPAITLNFIATDHDFIDVMKLEMAEGRFFSKEFSTDSTAIIINETASRLLGWDEPIGKTFRIDRTTLNVIGIVKDYHYESMHQLVRPMGMLLIPGIYNQGPDYASIKVNTENFPETISFIEKTWKEFASNMPLDYFFFDDYYDQLYKNEQKTGKVFMLFSFLSVFIASLGLFGLAAFVAEQSTKEIGIRKTLGASISSVVVLLSKDFVKWVVVANVVAWPLGFIFMNIWLQGFAYRIDMGFIEFFLAGFIAFLIALITVSFQSIKAAIVDPVRSLRYE